MRNIFLWILGLLVSFNLQAQYQSNRFVTGKVIHTQVGASSGKFNVSCNFTDEGGLYDGTNVSVGDLLFVSDSGYGFYLPIDSIISSGVSTIIVRVVNTSLSLGAIPTGVGYITKASTNFQFQPFISGISDANQQISNEDFLFRLDSILNYKLPERTDTVPSYTPGLNDSRIAQDNNTGFVYYYDGSNWQRIGQDTLDGIYGRSDTIPDALRQVSIDSVLEFIGLDTSGYFLAEVGGEFAGGRLLVKNNQGKLYFYEALSGTSYLSVNRQGIVLQANTNGTDDIKIQGLTRFNSILTPVTLNATANNYNPTSFANCNVLRLTSSSDVNITGFSNGRAGRLIIVENVGTKTITFVKENGGSTAANRFGSDNVSLSAGNIGIAIYDSTASRWRMSGSGNSGTTIDTFYVYNDSLFLLTSTDTFGVDLSLTVVGDDWGSQVANRDSSLTGNGVTPLGIKGYGAASNGQVPSKATDGITWITPLTAEVDGSITNEGQLNVSGVSPPNSGVITSNTSGSNTIILEGGSGITITPNPGTHTITIEGNSIGLIDTVRNMDSLRAYTGDRPVVFLLDAPQTGFFKRLDTIVSDDGGILIHGNFDWVRYGENLDVVNVKWFGAVGDSLTDDTNAKDLALDYCKANQGTTLYFPKGKYRLTSSVYYYKPVNFGIKGDGEYATYLFFVNCNGVDLRTDSVTYQTDAFYSTIEGRDLSIEKLSIHRVGTYTTKQTGLNLRGVGFNIVLRDVRVQHWTSILGTLGSVGINMDASIPDSSSIQHTDLYHVYVSECDTNIISHLRDVVNFNDVRCDQANAVGVVIRNSIHWKGGMVQGSQYCGIYLDNTDPFVLYDTRFESIHFETNGTKGHLYKPDATDMKNLTVKNCQMSNGGHSVVMDLKRVLYMDITDNSYNIGTTDSIKLTSIYAGRFGNDNYTSGKLITSDVYIDWWNGSSSAVAPLVGFTIGKSSPGRNFLNVGGDTGIDGELGIGTQVPLAQLHVKTSDIQDTSIIRLDNTTGFTQLFRSTATPEGDVAGNPGDFAFTNLSGTGSWFGKLTGTGNTGWVEFYHTGNLPSSVNIYTDNGTIDDTTRYVYADSSKTFAIGQFPSFPDYVLDGRENGFYYSPEYFGGVSILSSSPSDTSITECIYYPAGGSENYSQGENSGNLVIQKYGGNNSNYLYINQNSSSISDFSGQHFELAGGNSDGEGVIDGLSFQLNSGSPVPNHNFSFGRTTGTSLYWPNNTAMTVRTIWADGSVRTFDWLRIDLPMTNDSLSDQISLYNYKYRLPNERPSVTSGDSSTIVWVGNGTTTVPMFAPYSSGGSGTNVYNSSGTTTENTRNINVIETLNIVGTADTGDPYPFQVHVTGNESPIQLWKGSTDSVWIKQSDVEYHFGSSTALFVESNSYLGLSADSITANTLESVTKLHNIVGISSNGVLKKIAGSSSNQVLKWNTGGYWELGTVSGAVADGDYGDITVSSSGTVWSIDAGSGGIYEGSGTIPDNAISTVTSNGDFKIAYNGSNPAFAVDDALNQTYISGKSGTYSVYADNSNSGLVSGTATWLVGSDYALTATASVANTNTAADRLIIKTNSTGTPAISFGGDILFQGESSTTDNQDMGKFSCYWNSATHASREGRFGFQLGQNGGALTEFINFNRANDASGAIVVGTSNAVILTRSSLTTATSYTIGNSAQSLIVGGSSGALTIFNTSASSGAIQISNTSNTATSTGNIIFGNGTALTQTSGTRNYLQIDPTFSPSSGTAVHNSLVLNGIFNQTGGANGITRGIYLNQTLTAVADFRGLEIAYSNSSAKGIYQTGANTTNNFVGKTTFGATTSPTALVLLAAGTASANTSPLKFTSGTNLTTPENGSMEYDGTELYFTASGATRTTVSRILKGSATLNFGSTAGGASSDLTITVTGAVAGDAVYLGVPNGSVPDNGTFFAWVSATDTVTVRYSNNDLTNAKDPASGTFNVSVQK